MKIISLLCFITIMFSCKENNIKIDNLTFNQFKNTKWIIGEVGLNGEKPDTIIFDQPKTLTYISTDTGKETCKYKFVKDTLIYTSFSIDFDIASDKERTCVSISKFHFENNTFKYIICCQKFSHEKKFRCTNMEKYGEVFKKI